MNWRDIINEYRENTWEAIVGTLIIMGAFATVAFLPWVFAAALGIEP